MLLECGENRTASAMAIKYILSLVFVFVYILFGNEIGFATNSPWWTHLTYSLQHANILHLVINTLVFINVFRVMQGFTSWKELLPLIYVIAVGASFFATKDIPTVGASGMIYAMFGMMSVIVAFNKSTPKQKLTFFCSIGIMLLISYFNSNSNFMVHILAFCAGAIVWILRGKLDNHLNNILWKQLIS